MNRTSKFLIASQAVFLISSCINFLTLPNAFRENAAISYYGTNLKTVPVYVIAGMATVALIVLAAKSIAATSKAKLISRISLVLVAACMTLAIMTPYSVNQYFFVAHMTAGALLLITMFATSVLLTWHFRDIFLGILSFLILSLAALMVLSFGFWDIIHVLAWAELAIGPTYAVMIWRALRLDQSRQSEL